MKVQDTIDMIAALTDHDTEQATLEELKEAYWNNTWRYYEDLDKEELEDLYNAIQSETT